MEIFHFIPICRSSSSQCFSFNQLILPSIIIIFFFANEFSDSNNLPTPSGLVSQLIWISLYYRNKVREKKTLLGPEYLILESNRIEWNGLESIRIFFFACDNVWDLSIDFPFLFFYHISIYSVHFESRSLSPWVCVMCIFLRRLNNAA